MFKKQNTIIIKKKQKDKNVKFSKQDTRNHNCPIRQIA